MRLKLPEKYIFFIVGIAAITALVFWLLHDPVRNFSENKPGLDNRPPIDTSKLAQVTIGEKFTFYENQTSQLTGKWPNFRGVDFDNINKEKIPLIDSWENGKPKIVWQALMGEGHAAPAIYDGRVYILDYDENKKADALRCFSLESGKELWKRWYKVPVKRNHGMSRTIPAVNEKYVVSIGPVGHVMCVDRITGNFIWGIDLVKEYGAEIPFWYTGQCPFIDNGVAVIAPGGKSLLIGVDCATGQVVWKTPSPDGWKMSHSSVIPMTWGGTKMYVYAAIGGICGVSAESGNTGQLLWQTTAFAPSVVAPSPVVFNDGKIFVTAGYGAGSAMLKLEKGGGGFSVKVLQIYKPKDGLASEQQTPVVLNGKMYAVLPKDAAAERNQFVCCDPSDCTKYLWTSGKTERFGLGPYLFADGKFFILDDDGTLTIARISNSGFEVLDKTRIIEGQDAWGPFALADGYLLMRDSKNLVCLDVRKNPDK